MKFAVGRLEVLPGGHEVALDPRRNDFLLIFHYKSRVEGPVPHRGGRVPFADDEFGDLPSRGRVVADDKVAGVPITLVGQMELMPGNKIQRPVPHSGGIDQRRDQRALRQRVGKVAVGRLVVDVITPVIRSGAAHGNAGLHGLDGIVRAAKEAKVLRFRCRPGPQVGLVPYLEVGVGDPVLVDDPVGDLADHVVPGGVIRRRLRVQDVPSRRPGRRPVGGAAQPRGHLLENKDHLVRTSGHGA